MTDFHPPIKAPIHWSDPSVQPQGVVWSFAAVEERMIEAALLWRRSPGGGRWPFASDGPWHLLTRETRAGDYDARGGEGGEAPALRSLPLSRDEVMERDEASGWLELVDERDRRLVALAIAEQARTSQRVNWMAMRAKMGIPLGAEGLRKRYSRSITAIARQLTRRCNSQPV